MIIFALLHNLRREENSVLVFTPWLKYSPPSPGWLSDVGKGGEKPYIGIVTVQLNTGLLRCTCVHQDKLLKKISY